MLLAVRVVFANGAPVSSDPPIVVLVSFDGWRWDYLDRGTAPHLRALAARGIKAAGLIPSFPPKTFPNHYTIVTGLFPEHHGIVGNVIADPAFPERFTMAGNTAADPHWWLGEPVWITAMRQGLRTASMFWPGSEVRGSQPTYWRPFDDALPDNQRVDQVLEWLALPADRRPSFITIYFSAVDHAGHDHGPESPEVSRATTQLDVALGALIAGVEELHLSDRTSFVIVSDHGMSALSDNRVIFLDDYLDLSTVDVVEWSPLLALRPRTTSADAVYRALRGRHPALTVYKREHLPSRLHYRASSRIPPVIGLADDGWTITSRERFAQSHASGRVSLGDHGYDPKFKAMQGLFVAAGPLLRRGVVVPSFSSVHLYDFLCRLLGVEPAANDGDVRVTRDFFARERP